MTPRYSEETIQQVIESNDIVELVSEYVALKKAGSSFKGRCPFHNEKTASFTVSAEKQLYHCFGCGVGGNSIGFVMAIENLDFMDALKFLARRGGVILPERGDSSEDQARYRHKERLYELHRELANFYYLCLKKNKAAYTYLTARGITSETIKAYGLGYAPGDWQTAYTFLQKKGYTEQEIMDSGLVMSSDNGRRYDRFRNRIMFPILNATGRIIGFGGRQFGTDQQGPKYLNSPETPVFTKGYELFNLNHAKNAAKNRQILIVEGYMDVISLFQKGIKNTVAALGTAFTIYHAKLLGRYADEIILCFDGDTAGENATQKALAILKDSPLAVRILRLPPEEDPDTFIIKYGRETFEERIREAITVVEYELGLLGKRYDLNHSDERVKYVNAAVNVLRKLEDPMEADMYSRRLARQTSISYRIIKGQVLKRQAPQLKAEHVGTQADYWGKLPKAYEEAQILYLKYGIDNPEIFERDVLKSEDFSPGFFRDLYDLVTERVKMKLTITPAAIMSHFEGDEEKVRPLAHMLMSGVDSRKQDMETCIRTIHRYRRAEITKEISEAIKIAQIQNDFEKSTELMQRLVELKKEEH